MYCVFFFESALFQFKKYAYKVYIEFICIIIENLTFEIV